MLRTLIFVPLLAPALVLAGPLTPPAGPVAPTMKTLTEMDTRIPVNAQTTPGTAGGLLPSVYTISQPGSYYLTGPLAGQAGKATILIAASDVTLDLCGYTITGGEAGIFAGDFANNTVVRGVCVRNGSVRSAVSIGVGLSGAHGARLENMTATGCTGTGLRIGAAGSMINCSSVGNGRGFDADSSSTVTACRAMDNTEEGFYTPGSGVSFIGCTASGNGHWGFYAAGAALSDCSATGNDDSGFVLSAGSTARGCTASTNTSSGFQCLTSTVLDRCVASQNAGSGFTGASGTRIEGCSSQSNGAHGIWVTGSCMVVGNVCNGNGTGQIIGAGVLIGGQGNVVLDNQVLQNETGIDTFAGAIDNVVARNVARANSQGNFDILAGNELAPVVTNPGSNSFTTATPWSNFAF